VRMALVNLDHPPTWFKREQAFDHMTAEQARTYAGTDGRCCVGQLVFDFSVSYRSSELCFYCVVSFSA
jgi:hypothetical protein